MKLDFSSILNQTDASNRELIVVLGTLEDSDRTREISRLVGAEVFSKKATALAKIAFAIATAFYTFSLLMSSFLR